MMRIMKRYRAGLKVVLILLPVAMAAPALAAVTVTVAPHSATKAPNKRQQFTAAVAGSSDQNVSWLVNGVPGGAPSIGTISATGQYTAPVRAVAFNTAEGWSRDCSEDVARAVRRLADVQNTDLSDGVADFVKRFEGEDARQLTLRLL